MEKGDIWQIVKERHRICLLSIRILIGGLCIVHGILMIRSGFMATVHGLAWMFGFPDAVVVGLAVIGVELICGMCVLLGVMFRFASLLVTALFSSYILSVLTGRGWYGSVWGLPRVGGFLPITIVEYCSVVLAIGFCMAYAGPGALALGDLTGKGVVRRSKRELKGVGLLRIVIGAVVGVHGVEKFVYFGLSAVCAEFVRLHFPFPEGFALGAAVVESISGVLLMTGMGTRWAACVIAIEMGVALLFVHFQQGFLQGVFWPGGYEYVLLLCGASISLIFGGSGAFVLWSDKKRQMAVGDVGGGCVG